jgi:DNA (cytosine-5)-methyltransferase 1
MDAVGLFAGIGGIELGLQRAGWSTSLLCEVDPAASRVLADRFPGTPLVSDVRTLRALPKADLVTAGFPCQDLSQAGTTAGITGARSGLVDEVFRLLSKRRSTPTWLLLENVPFMLHLDRGRAMAHLTARLGELGFAWAYRVVDTRAFGLPQRRQRVILVASRTEDPRPVVLAEQASPNEPAPRRGAACGFYWTEGLRGLGWAVDAVPTLKGGSTVGIPSPPAIWFPDGSIATPDVRDAERLQGFPADWTARASVEPSRRNGPRWKLVGNAVSVPVAQWIGERLVAHGHRPVAAGRVIEPGERWPRAAWGHRDEVRAVESNPWPRRHPYQSLATFLESPTTPLSTRALSGFLSRARRSTLRFPDGLLQAVEDAIDATARAEDAVA